MFSFLNTKITKIQFCEKMLAEYAQCTDQLEYLINKNRDNDLLRSGCALVSKWIVVRAIHEPEFIDIFFRYQIEADCKDESAKDVAVLQSKIFQHLNKYFEVWANDPLAGSELGAEILKIAKGDDSTESDYGDTECLEAFMFFAEKFKALLEKASVLRKRVK